MILAHDTGQARAAVQHDNRAFTKAVIAVMRDCAAFAPFAPAVF